MPVDLPAVTRRPTRNECLVHTEPYLGPITRGVMAAVRPNYRGEINPWVKGSVCLVLELALPPFLPHSPLWWKFQNVTGSETLTQGLSSPCTVLLCCYANSRFNAKTVQPG